MTTKVSNIRKAKILTCSMIENQFSYCSLIWMMCLKINMQRVEKVQSK